MATRRTFLQTSLTAGVAFGLGGFTQSLASLATAAVEPMKILILGGTRFLGPALVEAAQARGHTLTLFNRGKSRPDIFPDVEQLRGDRDPLVGEGLKALEGRTWDAVIDTSGYYPRIVKASAELLAPNVKHYTFISTISVYRDTSKPGSDETAPLATMEDPTVEEMGANFENYGPLKALCEQAAEAAMPSRVANVRPGFIVGPLDDTDRFTYWPVRIDRGGEVLVPGNPNDPIQIIDVRDLAAWIIHLAENRTAGIFNAAGPEKKLSWGEMLDACVAAAAANKATLTWVPADFLNEHRQPGDNLPIWIPPVGPYAGFHCWSNDRAVKAGLKFRPIKQTVQDTLSWFKTLPEARQASLRAGLSSKREAELLAAWHEHKDT